MSFSQFCAAPTLIALVGQTDAPQVSCLLQTALRGTPGVHVHVLPPDTPALSSSEALSAHLNLLSARQITHVILLLDQPALTRHPWAGLHISVTAPLGRATTWDGIESLLSASDVAVFDLDETGHEDYGSSITIRPFTYSENKARADLTARNLRLFPGHTEFEAVATGRICRVHLPVCGGFAVYHALCALACGLCLGLEPGQMAHRLRAATGPSGCMEVLPLPTAYTVLLDRAADLYSLERTLTTARSFTARRLVCLLDCGSQAMKELADQLADRVLTFGSARADRRQAIVRGLDRACPGDVLVLTGTDGGAEERAFIRACAHNCALRRRQRI